MKQKKDRRLARNKKEIKPKDSVKTNVEMAEKEQENVRAIANADFIEPTPVEEQDEAAPRH